MGEEMQVPPLSPHRPGALSLRPGVSERLLAGVSPPAVRSHVRQGWHPDRDRVRRGWPGAE